MPKRASRNQPMRWSRLSIDWRHQARSSPCWAGGSLLLAGDSSWDSPLEEAVAHENAPPSRQTNNRGNVDDFVFMLMEGHAVSTRIGRKGRLDPAPDPAPLLRLAVEAAVVRVPVAGERGRAGVRAARRRRALDRTAALAGDLRPVEARRAADAVRHPVALDRGDVT